MIRIFFDGACYKQNKGKVPTGIGVYIDDGRFPIYPTLQVVSHVGMGTNNTAEWQALHAALTVARHMVVHAGESVKNILILGDSQVIINQYNEIYSVNQPHLKHYYMRCKRYAEKHGLLEIPVMWVPRTQNTKADELSKKALTLPAPNI